MDTLLSRRKTSSHVQLAVRRAIAESIFGPIEWIDEVTGYLTCPGKHLHTNRNGKRHCQIKLDGVPTLFCVHGSCAGLLAEKNRLLRSAIAKAERGESGEHFRRWTPMPADIQRKREHKQADRLERRAQKSLRSILERHSCEPIDFWENSPLRLDEDALNDYRLQLRLFKPDDTVWIGGLYDSGEPIHARNFRTVAEWLKESFAPAQHICPNAFKPGVYSRTAENIIERRFLVVESDPDPNKPGKGLEKNDFCAVLKWLQQFLRMRAIVDTAGKSLHGWFDYPDAETLRELETILPALKCDGALFQPAHTCRLPGAMRDGKRQHLIYVNPGGAL